MIQVLPAPVINFTHHGPNTRITEWSQFTSATRQIGQPWTTLTYEEPCDYKENNMERFYPVKDINGKNRELYKKYSQIENPKVTFIGRLGLYAYLDMHQAVSSALAIAEKYKITNGALTK
jgi:UDP-galactopyranose mutase